MKDFCQDRLPSEDSPIEVKSFPKGYFNSFGKKNPDKIFYVIWLDNLGSGFFSNLSAVLCHLKIADAIGMIPVIDFKNFRTLYNVNTPINNVNNAWEYYFKPVSPFSLDEVYDSKNVFFCSGSYPSSMSYSITTIEGLYDEIYKKYVILQSNVEEYLKKYSGLFKQRVLGVHFRGKEQNLAPGHSFAPTEKQMIKYSDEIIEKYNIDKIFLVTEEQRYLDLFIKNYGEKVFYTDSFRSYKINSYNVNPRENHRYLLGLEVLVDAQLLSMCSGILCGDSNVSEYSRFINNKEYDFIYIIQNGVNSSNLYLARYLYRIKKMLPPKSGGLLDIVDRSDLKKK
jgi:hypothetical protein